MNNNTLPARLAKPVHAAIDRLIVLSPFVGPHKAILTSTLRDEDISSLANALTIIASKEKGIPVPSAELIRNYILAFGFSSVSSATDALKAIEVVADFNADTPQASTCYARIHSLRQTIGKVVAFIL